MVEASVIWYYQYHSSGKESAAPQSINVQLDCGMQAIVQLKLWQAGRTSWQLWCAGPRACYVVCRSVGS
jgi:hypothetical protein